MERSMDYYRGRRLRQNCVIRDFCRETKPLGREELIMPYFVVETDDRNYRKEIPSMPGQYQLSLAQLEKMVAKDIENGNQVEVDFDSGMIYNRTKGTQFQGQAFPEFMQRIITAGGLVNYINGKETHGA